MLTTPRHTGQVSGAGCKMLGAHSIKTEDLICHIHIYHTKGESDL